MNCIKTGFRNNEVITISAGDRVVHAACRDKIVSVLTRNQIATSGAIKRVVPCPPFQSIVARVAKQQFPKIKVLFTSGYSESETFREAFEDGKAELIPKPYRKETLAKRLQEVLQS